MALAPSDGRLHHRHLPQETLPRTVAATLPLLLPPLDKQQPSTPIPSQRPSSSSSKTFPQKQHFPTEHQHRDPPPSTSKPQHLQSVHTIQTIKISP
ncbi:hypothetical protein BCR33DRAFT_245132 [Rhizoclosmatium globosum]|uniref:Uncharacterized protein n=1 Tax=Rhizoclosmatium globosum TaxID=329046 RepID=A0A1Y2C9D2_9FUNG|nr:hypothetical protein BCR33DRAFT_245132 [Rhizoclosmatium globosum]|eukprot:ORY43629.1 hypothetical protein BCR33DRAFT_245132 [Rhizoclosmatium globosum]